MRANIIVQARASSGRFPNKILKKVRNKSLIEILIKRLKKSKECKKIILAIPKNNKQKRLKQHLQKLKVKIFEGSEKNVLDRFYKASIQNKSDLIVRVTGDCPIMDPGIIDKLVRIAKKKKYDYVSNVFPPSFPNGLDVSVMTAKALYKAWKNSKTTFDKEHVVPFIQKSKMFKRYNLKHSVNLSQERWTVDEPEDFDVIKKIILNSKGLNFKWKSILNLKIKKPEIFYDNKHILRDEGSNKRISINRKSWRKVNKIPPGRILIFGSKGFLAKKMIKYFKKKKYEIYLDSSYKKRIKKNSNYNFLLKILNKIKPRVVINLLALTDVDKCERNKLMAKRSNILFPKNLTKAIKKTAQNIYLVHLSTDQVYSGNGNHKEKTTKPINYYGHSKLLGEKYFQDIQSVILRTNFVGKGENIYNKTLSDWLVKNLTKKIRINTFKNIFFSPLHTSTLITIIDKLIHKKIIGIYNLGSKNKISKAKFASLLALKLNFDFKLLNKVNYKKNLLLAKRPLDMSLSVKNFERDFNMKLPFVNDEIIKLSREYK